jgi:hypothetical protein
MAETTIPFPNHRAANNIPAAPVELGVAGTQLWHSILAEWDIADAAGLAILREACHARDTSERLRKQIAVDGDMIELASGGGTKANPLILMELQSRALTMRLLSRLGILDKEPKRGPGRPPGPGCW